MQNSKVTVRPLTVVCIALAAVLVLVGIIYVVSTANGLPSFFPGHAAGSTHHHVKHGLAAFTLAILALIGGWFTTAPARQH